MADDDDRPNAPPASRLGRLARLGALSTRAIPMATEAMRRSVFGKRKDADSEREAQERATEAAHLAEALEEQEPIVPIVARGPVEPPSERRR